MIAYPARTSDPLVALDVGDGGYFELTPDEAADLADQLAHAADLCGAACAVASCNAHPIGTHGMCASHD